MRATADAVAGENWFCVPQLVGDPLARSVRNPSALRCEALPMWVALIASAVDCLSDSAFPPGGESGMLLAIDLQILP